MSSVSELVHAHPHALRVVIALAVLALVPLATRIVRGILRRVAMNRLRIPRLGRGAATKPRRLQRQKAAATLVESFSRYLVAGAALVVALTIISPSMSNAVFGASLLVIIVGFGLQRLLQDVVAGTLLLFEGHIGVGDYIFVHLHAAEGVVEEFSLRSTQLRTLDGSTVVVMNSAMQCITRYAEHPSAAK